MSNDLIKRWCIFALGLLIVAGIAGMAIMDSRGNSSVAKVPDYKAWDPKVLEVAELLPVQDGGRVKPLGTYAGFTMLQLHGEHSMEVIGQGEKGPETIRIKPLAWMMDCFFRPELAKELPTFRVDNSEVITAIGLKPKDRRDRYSYKELEPGLPKLMELKSSYEKIARQGAEMLKITEQQTLDLARNVDAFQFFIGYMGPARDGLLRSENGSLVLNVSQAMEAAPKILADINRARAQGLPMTKEAQQILEFLIGAANDSKYGLLIFPPLKKADDKWYSAGDRLASVFDPFTPDAAKSEEQNVTDEKARDAEDAAAVEDIKSLEQLTRSISQGQASFGKELTVFKDRLAARATERGEYKTVPMEASYFSKNWFIYALVWFLLATVTGAVMFFTGKSAVGTVSMYATLGSILLGLVYLIIPIIKRSMIMHRPPVGNLYDTIVFIAMAVVIFGLVVEALTRRRFVLGIVPIFVAFLIVLARRFEVGEGRDHLDPLVAVLRSNYWLSTHVITITLGYAAGLMTSLLSVVYVLIRALNLDEGDPGIRRSLTRAVYGCVCLTLLLSLIGTVLGGIWANDFWGRFWGWDPKENGALMIVLWSLAILHARIGGYIKEWGLHLAALFGGNVIAFSWWHVNFLNTGLHNYGFAADKAIFVWLFYGLMTFLTVIGAAVCLFERYAKAQRDAERKALAALSEMKAN